MLPEDYHERACQIFCRLLHRLERLEHGENHSSSETTDPGDDSDAIMENGTANVVIHPDLPPRQHARAKKERVSRNAGR